ncbi:phosphomannomutase [Shewanella sp. JM162201]|uniref:Phosphomannomutase n=1 Tax=Shewanella jiangmenensis TaxID=2837387 RepID=A0ABS5V3Q5_9GAMM|nr:phosphomannomutase [Shewanella jiangmenensis]MBT1445090.1 phosphomannomutase [Shewanella jiangmenensis]
MNAKDLISKEIIETSGVKFGTSGARGLVTQFTDRVCGAFTLAFLTTLQTRQPVTRLAVAIDRRPSSPDMAAACIGAARALGIEVDYMGTVPTPALALYALDKKIPAIMVTGSHIPFDRNGLKFYRPDGEIDKQDEADILACKAPLPAFEPQRPEPSNDARRLYCKRYMAMFPDTPLDGMRIGLYEHSAAGRDISAAILSALGAEVISLGRTETFVPIDTEAVSHADKLLGQEWAEQHQLDALFSTDGDGDRPLLADEHGQWLRGDILGLLCADTLGYQALAVPVSCNSAIELSGRFTQIKRTRIGSPYVIEAMLQLSSAHEKVAGFEANGGFMTQELPTRDALLPALAVLVRARTENRPLSQLLASLPGRFTASDRLQDVCAATAKPWLDHWQQDIASFCRSFAPGQKVIETSRIDGLRMGLNSGDVIHIRPSGNAPELRCYVESGSETAATALLQHALQTLNNAVRSAQ